MIKSLPHFAAFLCFIACSKGSFSVCGKIITWSWITYNDSSLFSPPAAKFKPTRERKHSSCNFNFLSSHRYLPINSQREYLLVAWSNDVEKIVHCNFYYVWCKYFTSSKNYTWTLDVINSVILKIYLNQKQKNYLLLN